MENKVKIKRELEMRMFVGEIRAEEQNDGVVVISGRPVVYGSRTDLGYFDEIIEPGALDGTDLRDVRLLVNHDTRMIPLARSRRNNMNSTMRLVPDAQGLLMEFAKLDTRNNSDARSLVSAIERGDISGMSFLFFVDSDKWDDLESDHPTRHILRIASIVEVSCVTFPAYEASSVEIKDQSASALESARQKALENARAQSSGSVETEKKADSELKLLKEKIKTLF